MPPTTNNEPQDPQRFPRRFGPRYVLLKELGRGGMGRVFMALTGQAGVERVCALKILRSFQAGHHAEEMTQRFLDEAKIVTKLSHENLVYVFDFGVHDRQGYLAMEYVQGKTFTEAWNRCAVKHTGFPTGVAIHIIAELVAALGYAHRLEGMNLVHRDISPSNLMLTYTGGVKLIDFGLAQWNDKVAQTAAGTNWGKVSYMSPEQYLGKPVDHRSDLFSAGIIMWELLTGRQLFPATQSRQASPKIPPPSTLNEALSAKLDEVVGKALAFSPADRFATGEEMSAALVAEMPRDGGGKLAAAAFLTQLFDAEMRAEMAERRDLLQRVSELGNQVPVLEANDSAASENDPLIGKVLGDRYHVRRRIGEGAMGRVYEGHHTGIGKRVAIKVPRHVERRKSELARRFQREALAPSQIGHPNVVDVTDCGTTEDGDYFFVMEFVDGVDLEALIKRDGAMAVERTLLVGVQMCRALEAAHRAGIIHRDLKPSNVMLVRPSDEQGDLVKVLDFGVAKFLRDEGGPNLTVPDAAVGTPRFMAPEQIGGSGVVDFRADIYALGGLLYFMLSGGHSPIEGSNVQNVWQRKLTEDPTPLHHYRSDLPDDLEALIMQCLARDANRRPASAEDLKKLLLAALEEARTISSSLAGLRVPSTTAVVPGPGYGSLWWKTLVVVTATAVVGWIAARPFFVHRASRPHPALSQTRTVAPPPAAVGGDATTAR
ncbi:MAG TPA: serine/threonine-protein kinase [Polyangia bacterium]|nr:serine/threonine-protein kinase [Polyangia bacterium]